MSSITGLGKWLLLIPFAMFGFNHITKAGAMAGMVPGYMPGGGELWTYITGIGMLAFVVSAIIGKFDKLAAILTAVMMLCFILMIHVPSMGDNPMGIVGALKDLGLAAGCLMYAHSYAKDNSVVG